MWAPQTVDNILTIERLQRRESKFILSLPYKTPISYKKRLATIGIFPLCYWHEYLDMVYLHKCLINNSDSNISIKIPTRETRNTSSTNGILLHATKSKTIYFQNSFYIRAANVWNTLPGFIRNTTTSLTTFKCNLMKYYVELTQQIYDPEDPRTFKFVVLNVIPLTNERINSNMLLNLAFVRLFVNIRLLCLLVFVFNCYVCFNFEIIRYTISCSFLEPRYWRTISVWKLQSFVTTVLYIDLLQWQTCKIKLNIYIYICIYIYTGCIKKSKTILKLLSIPQFCS